MKIKVTSYDKEKNHHYIEFIEKHPTKSHARTVDFFVGCAIDVPVDPYNEEEYNRIANDLIGKQFELDEDSWSERHQMWLPQEYHIKEITNISSQA